MISIFIRDLTKSRRNSQAAAQRLVSYWKFRRDLFGEKFWLLPMTQVGAMADDLDTLAKGLVLVLPNDAKGRAVFFFDRTAMKPEIASRKSFVSGECHVSNYYFEDISSRALSHFLCRCVLPPQ